MFEELDVVELTHDIKTKGLKKGEIGAIVNVYNDGEAYEVEFVEPSGNTEALLTLIPEDIQLAESKSVISAELVCETRKLRAKSKKIQGTTADLLHESREIRNTLYE